MKDLVKRVKDLGRRKDKKGEGPKLIQNEGSLSLQPGPLGLNRSGNDVDTYGSKDDNDASLMPPELKAIINSECSNVFLKEPRLRYFAALQKFDKLYKTYASDRPEAYFLSIDTDEIESVARKAATSSDIAKSATIFGQLISELFHRRELERKPKQSVIGEVGHVLSKFYPLMALSLRLIQGASDVVSFAPAKAAVNGLTVLLQIVQEEAGRAADFEKYIERIGFHAQRLRELHKHPPDVLGDILCEKSLVLMTAIIEFLSSSLVYFKRSLFYNLAKTLVQGSENYSTTRAQLELAISEYDQALLFYIANHLLSQTTNNFIPHEDRAERFGKWLNSSHWEVESQRITNSRRRTPGTLQWVMNMDELNVWRSSNPDDSAEVLWLNGMPGVGKSTMSAFLIDLLERLYPDSVVLYFFCKNGDAKLSHARNIVKTFAHQLITKTPKVRSRLMELEKNAFNVEKAPITQLVVQLLQEPVSNYVMDLFMIIDGLDECQGSSSNFSMLEFMVSLKDIPHAKLLVTSRRTPGMGLAMSSWRTKDIDCNENGQDIALYVRSRVMDSKTLAKGFEVMGIDPVQYIQSRAEGIFLWSVLVLFEAERATSTKAFKNALETLPSGLNRVYEAILERVDAEGHMKCIREVLLWTIGAQRDLDLQELQDAVENVLGDCFIDFPGFLQTHGGSLVQIVTDARSRTKVRLVHESLRDFITDPSLHTTEYFIQPNFVQRNLASKCLRYLGQIEYPASFGCYAAQFWIEHLRTMKTETASDVEIFTEVYEFLHGRGVENWVKEEVRAAECYDFTVTYVHHIVDWLFSWFQKVEIPNNLGDANNWLRNVLETGMGSIHYCFSRAMGKVWLHGGLKEWSEIKRCFFNGIQCYKVSRESDMKQFNWESWFVNMSGFWTTDRLTVDEILSFAEESGYKDVNAACCANVGVALQRDFPYKAIEYYERAITIEPGNARFYLWLGNCYENEKRMDDALRTYKEGMVRGSDRDNESSRSYWKLYGKLCQKRGDLEHAIEAYKTAISIDPANAGINKGNYYESLAEVYIKRGYFESAAEVYRTAANKDPEWTCHYWDTFVGMYGKDTERQTMALLLAVENAANDTSRTRYRLQWTDIGKKFLIHNDFTRVKTILENALDKDAKGEEYYLEPLGQAYLCTQEWDNAVRCYDSLKHHSSDSAWIGLAMAYMGEEKYEKVEECCRRVFPSGRMTTWSQQLLFEAYIVQGKSKAAREFCATWSRQPKACKWDNTEAELLCDIGWFYDEDGDPLKAELSYELAAEIYREVCIENARLMEAEESVWETHGRNAYYLGLIYQRLKKLDQAKLWVEKAALIYGLTVGNDDSLTKEVLKTLGQLSDQGVPENVLPWRVRKERARLSEFRTCWAVRSPELAKPATTESPEQLRERIRMGALRDLANRDGQWRHLKRV